MNKKSIVMIGPFPPPIGGISIHTSRLVSEINKKYKIFKIDTSRNRIIQGVILLKLLILSKVKLSTFIVHNHVFKLWSNSIIVFLCKFFGVKYIQTIHSFRINHDELGSKEIKLIKFIIRNTYKTIAVSNKIREDLLQFDPSLSEKITVIPAFIPYENKQVSSKKYLDDLQISEFLKSHEVILCANAYKIVFYNNEDLYGLDLCIDLMGKIKQLDFNVGFIFMLPQISNSEYYNNLLEKIRELGLEQDFLFINKEVDLVPLFEYVDIFLRPTNTDGDALSIRESLYSGTPCIASDVVDRPLGTVTFKNRNVVDLYEKVQNVIINLEEEKAKVRNFSNTHEEFIDKYYRLYEKCN
ncbi:glycosyltransferase [Aquibacillus albus]|uniref:Glycosyltransferase involved in cell wall biosynthesis n=1 Tax=Aquibacillus albus TaxID=1168171 RepID=A0ABS2N0F1_9BACI|nr:glycosyltransferase [Aquibacillus albus]MBM7571380.1 glycosyltransferase involved in cell wall biosynthesis [Aquibacillus albus]